MPTLDPTALNHPARQFTLRNVQPPPLTLGDLLSVPEGVAHWFDLGVPALVKAIRERK